MKIKSMTTYLPARIVKIKILSITMLAKMQSSWNSHILLLGLQNSIITQEKMLAASYKVKHIAMTILSINPTLR